MPISSFEFLRSLLALPAGFAIGVSFGLIQNAAHRRYQKMQAAAKLNTGWAVMPGSFRRVAYLLVALALVQVLCPLLFVNGSQWVVSAGVAIGYGAVLYWQLRKRMAGEEA